MRREQVGQTGLFQHIPPGLEAFEISTQNINYRDKVSAMESCSAEHKSKADA